MMVPHHLRSLLVLISFLVMAPIALAYSEVTVMAPAVAQTTEGWVGVASWITVSSEPGDGRIFVDTFPLTQIDTQGSARLAAETAAAVAGVDLSEIDINVVIRSDAAVIGGPSAGGTLSIAILASLLNRTTNPKVSMTGTINPDGSIGPIGGILQKAEAAHAVGAERFLVPVGQTVSTTYPGSFETIDVAEYAKENWNLTVTEVHDLREAAKWMLGIEIKPPYDGGKIDLEKYNEVMGRASKDMMDSANDLIDEAQRKYDSASLTFQERNHLEKFLEDAKNKIEKAEQARSEETYYLSASYAFQSKINTTYVLYSLQYLDTKKKVTAKGLIEGAEEDAASALKTLNQTSFTSITAFECYAAAERRAHEAFQRVEDAWEFYYRSDLTSDMLNAIAEAAYIKQRSESALWWSSLCKEFPGDIKVNRSVLRDIAQEYVADLKYLLTYAESISGSSRLLMDAQILLQEVSRELDDEAYSAAILDTLNARSYLNAHLELGPSLSSSDEELAKILSEKMEKEKQYAIGSISASRDFGVNPILALSHLEFGESFAKEAEAISSPSQAIEDYLVPGLIQLKTARLVAEMSPVISRRLGKMPEDRIPPIIEPFYGEGGAVSGVQVEAVALIAGASLIVGLLVGVGIGQRRKKQNAGYGV